MTLRAGRVSRTVAGKAGANAVRFKPRLKPGRYRLRVSAGGASASARFADPALICHRAWHRHWMGPSPS